MLSVKILHSIIKKGQLTLIDESGKATTFGDGSGPQITIRLSDKKAVWELLFNPKLAVGELYMDGRLTFEEGSLYDFLMMAGDNIEAVRSYPLYRALWYFDLFFKPLQTLNPIRRSRKNVAHHYDLSARLYELFLDEDKQYSCAYFEDPDMTLEEAQAAKKKHIAKKLYLNKPGLDVLDIGSGWGGMALTLAEEKAARVKGITLSQEQLKISQQRARDHNLDPDVSFLLQDYRQVKGMFDRIVSVGMFEHVGPQNYTTFFRKIREILKDDGVFLLHSIGSIGEPGPTNPWIRKYIFPGGYTPSLSEVTSAIEKTGLVVTDIEVWRLHYAKTLKNWRQRFEENEAEIKSLYDERFYRMWDFYLTASEVSFRGMGQVVFQIQIAKRKDSLPLTRDYMYEDRAKQSQTKAKHKPAYGKAAE